MRQTGFSAEVRDYITCRAGDVCEVCDSAPIAEIHHRRPRGNGGTRRADTNQAANGLGLCRDCHRLIESYRTVAKLLGWLVPQGASPADVPVMYRGEWKVLTADSREGA